MVTMMGMMRRVVRVMKRVVVRRRVVVGTQSLRMRRCSITHEWWCILSMCQVHQLGERIGGNNNTRTFMLHVISSSSVSCPLLKSHSFTPKPDMISSWVCSSSLL